MQKKIEVQHGIANGKSFFDFGKSAFGTLEVELTDHGDHLVEIVIGEACHGDSILHEHGWRTFQLNRFPLKDGTLTYRFEIPPFVSAYGQFNYVPTPEECGGEIAPFRYVEVNHYYGPVTVRRTVWHDDWDDDASSFESSDPMLDKIWEFCKYSIKATNVFGLYIDGDRERRPYEGDAYINQLGHFCCDASYTVARDTIDYFKDHPTWPTEWQLLTPVLARDYWLYSGDRASVDRWLEWLPGRLLPQCEVKNGLVRGRDGIRDIIDWPESERDGYRFGEVNFVPNTYRVGGMNAMYELTGDDRYRVEAERLKKALRESMWTGDLPEDSPGAGHTSLHTAVFAVRFGIAEKAEYAKLADFIISRQLQCSVYGVQYCLEVCAMCGKDQYLLECLTGSGLRSWNHMLTLGSTITTEGWDDQIKPYMDWTHAWGAAPANLIPRWVAGIRPVRPGFEEYVLDPHPGGLEYFRYRQPTPSGPIDVIWENGKIRAERG